MGTEVVSGETYGEIMHDRSYDVRSSDEVVLLDGTVIVSVQELSASQSYEAMSSSASWTG